MKAALALLRHPRTAGLVLDDPETTARRRTIVREKRFLNAVYREWYETIAAAVPEGPEPILELGAGGGFLAECVHGLITSDVLQGSNTFQPCRHARGFDSIR